MPHHQSLASLVALNHELKINQLQKVKKIKTIKASPPIVTILSKKNGIKHVEKIYDAIHPKSYAAYVALKDDLKKAEFTENYQEQEWYKRILFSRAYLHTIKDRDNDLCCTYCQRKNLIIEEEGMKVNSKNKATIDHVTPVSKGGGVFSTENVIVACEVCNRLKADMPLSSFLKHYKHRLNPNYQILNQFL